MAISARQAWHDTFYIPKRDALQLVREEAKPVGKGQLQYRKLWMKETDAEGKEHKFYVMVPLIRAEQSASGKSHGFFESWDPIWRATVQGAVKSLPPILRCFGTVMYAPEKELNGEMLEAVAETIKTAYYASLKPEEMAKLRAVRILRINWMAFAALHFYRHWVFGGAGKVASPVEISNYIYQEFGDRIPHIEDHWTRDWADLWEAMITIIDQMERETLSPVARAITERENRFQEAS